MKLASHKHFFLCFFYQSAFCLTHTHIHSPMHLTLCSRPARGYLACSLEPPGVKLPTFRVLTGARSTSWAVRVKGWRWDSGAGAGRQLQPSCTDWETPPASLWSHRVCALCVSMLLCYSDELLRLWWLNKLLSSWRIPSTLCTTYWTVWQVTLLPDTLHASPASTSETNV